MRFRMVDFGERGDASGAVVVVDVLRAYTTAAYAFTAGVREIVLVSDKDEALQLREQLGPGTLAIGEVEGTKPPGFDFGNSPSELVGRDLSGRIAVLSTTAGTVGAVRYAGGNPAVGGAFVCAEATVRYLARRGPEEVTFVITGAHGELGGDEDLACAEYLAARLRGERADPRPYLDRVPVSDAGRRFGNLPQYPVRDLELAVLIDRFDVALPIEVRDGLVRIRPVRS